MLGGLEYVYLLSFLFIHLNNNPNISLECRTWGKWFPFWIIDSYGKDTMIPCLIFTTAIVVTILCGNWKWFEIENGSHANHYGNDTIHHLVWHSHFRCITCTHHDILVFTMHYTRWCATGSLPAKCHVLPFSKKKIYMLPNGDFKWLEINSRVELIRS